MIKILRVLGASSNKARTHLGAPRGVKENPLLKLGKTFSDLDVEMWNDDGVSGIIIVIRSSIMYIVHMYHTSICHSLFTTFFSYKYIAQISRWKLELSAPASPYIYICM